MKSKLYRLSDLVQECIKTNVSEILDLGMIDCAFSSRASSVVLVPKQELTDLQFCMNYLAHPIPQADELVETGLSQLLKTFDLTSAFWQSALASGAKEKTAFYTPEGFH